MPVKQRFIIAPHERRELQWRARSRTLPAEDVRRARLILRLAKGEPYSSLAKAFGCNRSYISRWKKRFKEGRLSGLYSRHAGKTPEKRTPKLEARILEWTRRTPPDGSSHWSTRRLAKHPDFEKKAADVIGLYVNPPQHAVVFSIDEKTAIQALDRREPVLPLSPGRAERHGFEYYRHGTLSLYAGLNTRSGEVIGKTASRHTSAEFVAFLSDVVASQPRTREIHLIADNLSAHKTKKVRDFLASHPRVHIHYTPTYSSWLNQVELWFSKIERDVIARGIFTSVADLRRKLMRYIRHNNKKPRPIKWTYTDPKKRIPGTKSVVTVH